MEGVESATVTIGNPQSGIKIAQAVSQVRGDLPDWLNLETVDSTLGGVVDGIAAKVTIPKGNILQILSNANYFMSKKVGTSFVDLGRILNQPSLELGYWRYRTRVTDTNTYFSVVRKATEIYPDMTSTVSYLDKASNQFVTQNCTSENFDKNFIACVGPILTLRNNSATEDRSIYIGTPYYTCIASGAFQPTNAMFSFRLVPSGYMDYW